MKFLKTPDLGDLAGTIYLLGFGIMCTIILIIFVIAVFFAMRKSAAKLAHKNVYLSFAYTWLIMGIATLVSSGIWAVEPNKPGYVSTYCILMCAFGTIAAIDFLAYFALAGANDDAIDV